MRGFVGLALASALVLAGCYLGPGPEHYVAIVKELDVPAGWQLAKSNVFGPDEDEPCEPFTSLTCPGAVASSWWMAMPPTRTHRPRTWSLRPAS